MYYFSDEATGRGDTAEAERLYEMAWDANDLLVPAGFAPGTKVLKSGYAGTVVREYLPDMYEVRLASGTVVVPGSELKLI